MPRATAGVSHTPLAGEVTLREPRKSRRQLDRGADPGDVAVGIERGDYDPIGGVSRQSYPLRRRNSDDDHLTGRPDFDFPALKFLTGWLAVVIWRREQVGPSGAAMQAKREVKSIKPDRFSRRERLCDVMIRGRIAARRVVAERDPLGLHASEGLKPSVTRISPSRFSAACSSSFARLQSIASKRSIVVHR